MRVYRQADARGNQVKTIVESEAKDQQTEIEALRQKVEQLQVALLYLAGYVDNQEQA